MTLNNFFSTNHIFDELSCFHYGDLFRKLSPLMGEICGVPSHELLTYLLKRERLGSTYWDQGIALPHGSLHGIQSPHLFFARLKTPISYHPFKKNRVDLVCFIWVPQEMENYGSQILLKMTHLFKDSDFCQRLRTAQTKEDLFILLQGSPLSLAA